MWFSVQTIAGNISWGCQGQRWQTRSAIMIEITCFLTKSMELNRCQSINITGINLSTAAGVKATQSKTPRHFLALTCSCPGASVMDSDEPELFNVPLPNKADRRESGRKWRPGRWRLLLVPRPNPFSPCVDSVCSSRTTVPLQVSTQDGLSLQLWSLQQTASNLPVKGPVWLVF